MTPAQSIRRRQHEHVLARAQPELEYILIPQLDVPARRHQVPVDRGPVGALQIDQVRPHLSHAVAELVAPLDVPELDRRVLLRAAGVVDGEVDDQPLAPDQPAAALGELHHLEQVGPLEDVQPPGLLGGRFARLGRFVVFEHHGGAVDGDGVGFGGEAARRVEVGFVFLFGFALVLVWWCGGGFLGDLSGECVFLRGEGTS